MNTDNVVYPDRFKKLKNKLLNSFGFKTYEPSMYLDMASVIKAVESSSIFQNFKAFAPGTNMIRYQHHFGADGSLQGMTFTLFRGAPEGEKK